LARELADVIHYFLEDARSGAAEREPPLVAVPVGEKEAVRLAFVWNLAVELARSGARPSLVVPEGGTARDLLPPAAVGGVLAPELILSPARDLAGLARDARSPERPARDGSLRLAVVPAEWIGLQAAPGRLLRWTLLFATPDPAGLDAACALAGRVAAADPAAEIGLTLHGVESVAEARAAFSLLAGRFEAEGGRPLRSYGLLLDELLVYRGVVERRPVVLSHPQSLASRALADVARLLLTDARDGATGAGT
jgi:hypothetical protein